ncbi:hypothetical protein ONP48_08580, partial [Salmonella enterica subsp. enterica serovar Montevideo]|nr:hypothetical protein [Salmonella enterica subsp. enterica serovar Montevideo]
AAAQVAEVAVAYQQAAIDTASFVTVDATLLGLPDSVAPQRYLSDYKYFITGIGGIQNIIPCCPSVCLSVKHLIFALS